MYLSHYNLAEKPFQISTDPKFLWLGEKHREALAVLKYGILNSQGFVLLTGDVGTGKTTLINALLSELDKETIVAVVSDPKLDKLEFLNLIAKAFKLKKTFEDKLDFATYFGHFLKAAYKENKKVLLIIDEAQNISLELLEEIRLLSNIEIPERKLLNIFFVGQNELNKILLRNECRPLRQRITVTYNIEPLSESETKAYVTHRLKVAGANNEIFNNKGIRKIYAFSKGYPRLINIVCDHALLTGYVKDLATITPKVVQECSKELNLPGETQTEKVIKVKQKGKQSGRFSKKAILYTCLLLLLIPLLYPPVSTTLKSYFTSAVNFYDELFQQLTGPAQSPNAQDSEVLQPERQTAESNALNEQQSQTELRTAAKDTSNTVQPLDKGSESISNSSEQINDLKDFKLVIPYDYNSNELTERMYGPLNECALIMLEDQSLELVIRAYTDNRGSSAYNKRLSEFRANIVKSYLVGQGVSPKRIKAIGMGEEDPIEPNATKEGKRANRRVEVELVAE